MDLINLPVEVLEKIFSYLTYDEMARCRSVSRLMNEICKRLLNRGFVRIERWHARVMKSVKVQLPRRESERRYHPLARHNDILTSLETRISMLNMTYTKFIDNGICCFIPGKVIDEMRRVLAIVETTKTPSRAHEVLQELRDISSMAIEHFDEKISPAFRKILQEGTAQPTPKPTNAILAPLADRQEMLHLRRRSVLNAKLSLYLASHYKRIHKRMLEYKKMACRQRKTIRLLSRKQKEHDCAMADLKKRIEECDIKYSELTHTNQAVGGKAIAGSPAEVPAPAMPLRHFSSQIKLDLSVLPIGTSKRSQAKLLPNIKPRKALIKLPSLSQDDSEPPSKIPKREIPSTSSTPTNLKSKSLVTIAKIRGIANEIRTLTNLNVEGKKRSLSHSALDLFEVEVKKQKLD